MSAQVAEPAICNCFRGGSGVSPVLSKTGFEADDIERDHAGCVEICSARWVAIGVFRWHFHRQINQAELAIPSSFRMLLIPANIDYTPKLANRYKIISLWFGDGEIPWIF